MFWISLWKHNHRNSAVKTLFLLWRVTSVAPNPCPSAMHKAVVVSGVKAIWESEWFFIKLVPPGWVNFSFVAQDEDELSNAASGGEGVEDLAGHLPSGWSQHRPHTGSRAEHWAGVEPSALSWAFPAVWLVSGFPSTFLPWSAWRAYEVMEGNFYCQSPRHKLFHPHHPWEWDSQPEVPQVTCATVVH